MSKDEDLQRFLNQRSDKFTIILNDNELKLFKNTKNVYDGFMCNDKLSVNFIGCIRHDRDIDDVTGQYKTIHYHVVIQFNNVYRIGSVINLIVNTFKCNENQITIDKCNSVCMQSRYLLHLDDFDKAQYFDTEAIVNDNNVFHRFLSLVIVRDIHDLISVVKHYNYDLEEIMLNVAHYDKWRKYINDLIINHSRRL